MGRCSNSIVCWILPVYSCLYIFLCLQAIRKDHERISDRFTALLSEWLDQCPKVDDLIEALQSPCVDRTDVAMEIISKIKNGQLVLW